MNHSAADRAFRRIVWRIVLVFAVAAGVMAACTLSRAQGQYPDNALHAWFDKLASGKGLCCSFADGRSVADVDWQTTGDPKNPYKVFLDGEWIAVPIDAVVDEPNKFGRAVVWPYLESGKTAIRCFMPGPGA